MASRKARRSSILKSRNSIGPGGDGGSEELYSSEGTDGGANTTRNLTALLRKRVSFSQTTQVKEFEKTSSFTSDGSNSASSNNIDMNQTVLDLDISVYQCDDKEEEIENCQQLPMGDYTRIDQHAMSVMGSPDIELTKIQSETEYAMVNPGEMSFAQTKSTMKQRSKKIDSTMMNPKDMSIYQPNRGPEQNSHVPCSGNQTAFDFDMSVNQFDNNRQQSSTVDNTRVGVHSGEMSLAQTKSTKKQRSKKIDSTMMNPKDMSIYQPNRGPEQNSHVPCSGNQTAFDFDMSVYQFDNNRQQSSTVDNTRVGVHSGEMSLAQTKSTKKQRSKKIDSTMLNPKEMSIYQPTSFRDQTLSFPADMSVINRNDLRNDPVFNQSIRNEIHDMSVYQCDDSEEEIDYRQQLPTGDRTRVDQHAMSVVDSPDMELTKIQSETEHAMMVNQGEMLFAQTKSTKKQRSKQKDCTMANPKDMSVYQPIGAPEQNSRIPSNRNQTAVDFDMSVYQYDNQDHEEIQNCNQQRRGDNTHLNLCDMSVVDTLNVSQQLKRLKLGTESTSVSQGDTSFAQTKSTKKQRSKKIDSTMMNPKDMSIHQPNRGPEQNSHVPCSGNQTAFDFDMSVYQFDNNRQQSSTVDNTRVGVHSGEMSFAQTKSTKKQRSKKIDSTMMNPKEMSIYQPTSFPDQTLCFPADMSVINRNDLRNDPVSNQTIRKEIQLSSRQLKEVGVEKPPVVVPAKTTAVEETSRPALFFGKPDPQLYRNPFGLGKNKKTIIKMNINSNQESTVCKPSFGVFGNPKTPKRNVIQLTSKIPPFKPPVVDKVLTVNEQVQTSPALMNLPYKTSCNVSINCTIANHTDDESTRSVVFENVEEGINEIENEGPAVLDKDSEDTKDEANGASSVADEKDADVITDQENGEFVPVENDSADIIAQDIESVSVENDAVDILDQENEESVSVQTDAADIIDQENEESISVQTDAADIIDQENKESVSVENDAAGIVDQEIPGFVTVENNADGIIDQENEESVAVEVGDDDSIDYESDDQEQRQQIGDEEEDDLAEKETCRSSTAIGKELQKIPLDPEVSRMENTLFHGTIQLDQAMDIDDHTMGDATGVVIDDGQSEDVPGCSEDDKQDDYEDNHTNVVEFDNNIRKKQVSQTTKNFHQDCSLQYQELEGIQDVRNESTSESDVEVKFSKPKRKPKQKCSNSLVSVLDSKIELFIKTNSDDPFDFFHFITSIEIDLAKLPEDQWNWISAKHKKVLGGVTPGLLKLRQMYIDCLGSRLKRLAFGKRFGL